MEGGKGGAGFFALDTNGNIYLAGYCLTLAESELDAHMKMLMLALRCMQMENINLNKIFSSSLELLRLVEGVGSESNWRLQGLRHELHCLLWQSAIRR